MENQTAYAMVSDAALYLLRGDRTPCPNAIMILGDAQRACLAQWELDRALEMQAHFLTSFRSRELTAA